MKLIDIIHQLKDFQIKIDEDLTTYSTMGLLSRGDLILAQSISELKKITKILSQNKLDYFILGHGSNFVLKENSPIPYIKLDLKIDESHLYVPKKLYNFPASIPLQKLTKMAIKFGLKGWEVFSGIPGTLGGAVIMNAGHELGDISSLVKEIKIITKNGKEKILDIKKIRNNFSYRSTSFCNSGDIIVEVTLGHHGISNEVPVIIKDYLKKRRLTQPLDKKTCGCLFKNIANGATAGKFLDILGLKGYTNKNIRINPLHANFLENLGGATYSDLIIFTEKIRSELYLQYGLQFDFEIKF